MIASNNDDKFDLQKAVEDTFREVGFPIESSRIVTLVRFNTNRLDLLAIDIRKCISFPKYILTDEGWILNDE